MHVLAKKKKNNNIKLDLKLPDNASFGKVFLKLIDWCHVYKYLQWCVNVIGLCYVHYTTSVPNHSTIWHFIDWWMHERTATAVRSALSAIWDGASCTPSASYLHLIAVACDSSLWSIRDTYIRLVLLIYVSVYLVKVNEVMSLC